MTTQNNNPGYKKRDFITELDDLRKEIGVNYEIKWDCDEPPKVAAEGYILVSVAHLNYDYSLSVCTMFAGRCVHQSRLDYKDELDFMTSLAFTFKFKQSIECADKILNYYVKLTKVVKGNHNEPTES